MSVLLKVEDAAAELQVAPIAIQRLIALGLLKAAIAGKDLRISPTALLAYIDAGAQNLKMPALDAGADDPVAWLKFDGADMDAGTFVSSIRDLMPDALPSDPPSNACTSTPNVSPVTAVTIPPSKPMLDLAKQKPSRGPFGSMMKPIEYDTKADWFAVSILSAILAKNTHSMNLPAQGLAMLYRSPEDFQQITNAAWDEYQSRFFRKLKVFAGTVRGSDATVSINYGVQYSGLGASKDVLKKML